MPTGTFGTCWPLRERSERIYDLRFTFDVGSWMFPGVHGACAEYRSPKVIRLTGLSKTFGRRVAVDNLNLHVPRGDIFGLLGHNGAGKSTAIGMMLGHNGAGKSTAIGM